MSWRIAITKRFVTVSFRTKTGEYSEKEYAYALDDKTCLLSVGTEFKPNNSAPMIVRNIVHTEKMPTVITKKIVVCEKGASTVEPYRFTL